MINYMITDADGGELINRKSDVCFSSQDYYVGGTPPSWWEPRWWKMYDFRGCVREEVFQPGTPYADGAEFMLNLVAKHIPEIPFSLEELAAGGVTLDCRARSAPYSRMVGGIMRAICERPYTLPALPDNYTKAVQAGMDESLALYYALSVGKDTGWGVSHSLDHGRVGSWFRLLPEMQERGKRFPPMAVCLSARTLSRPDWLPHNAGTFMEYMCTPLSGRLPEICYYSDTFRYLHRESNLFKYLLSVSEDK